MTSRLLVVGLVFASAACGKTVGTETGNPPVIATSLIRVEATDDDHVRVSGEAGAIEPGGGEVSVTNTTLDGEPVVAEVAEDGSFSVELEGTPDDDYEVVATNADGSSPARTVSGTGALPGDWQTLHVCDDSDPMDPLMVTALRIEGDRLHVDVTHGGGCAQHSYGLCRYDAWATSLPVQVGVQVLHDDGGDTCEALLSEELSFDLTPLQRAYAEQFGDGAAAASVGVDPCAIPPAPGVPGVEPDDVCRVLYEWSDPASGACGPPIEPSCPPFEIPEAPETWVAHPTECRFFFYAPDDVMEVDAQGIDSCVDLFENDRCTFHAGSGGFSGGLAEFDAEGEAQIGRATIEGIDAKIVTAVVSGEPRPYVAAAHFPEPPFATDSSFGVTAELVIFCTTRAERDAMLPVLGTILFN